MPFTMEKVEEIAEKQRKYDEAVSLGNLGRSVYKSKWWREYRSARKRGLTPTMAKREAGKLASIWYHQMKTYYTK